MIVCFKWPPSTILATGWDWESCPPIQIWSVGEDSTFLGEPSNPSKIEVPQKRPTVRLFDYRRGLGPVVARDFCPRECRRTTNVWWRSPFYKKISRVLAVPAIKRTLFRVFKTAPCDHTDFQIHVKHTDRPRFYKGTSSSDFPLPSSRFPLLIISKLSQSKTKQKQ